ncbi:unnamed protein product, partial [Discosporangium mesarthrocarpum]
KRNPETNKPWAFKVGTMVLVPSLGQNRMGQPMPRSAGVDREDLVGRRGEVIKSPAVSHGPNYHLVKYQPWKGGPSETVTWALRFNCLQMPPPSSREGSGPELGGVKGRAHGPVMEASGVDGAGGDIEEQGQGDNGHDKGQG